MLFQNRVEAGRKLAEKLAEYRKNPRKIILAIPRGGVVVGWQLAEKLNCPLDLVITKKIASPENPELALGAVGTAGEPVFDEAFIERAGIRKDDLKNLVNQARTEALRREKIFRGEKPPLNVNGRTVVLTDDGVATGATMMAAVKIIRQQEPHRITVAVPVIAKDALAAIESQADEVIFLEAPDQFFAVGQFYQDFSQISDKEVREILARSLE